MTRSPKESGFTLVEMVVTISLFALLVPATATFLDFITQLNTTAKTTASINGFAENKIEAIRSAGYTASANVTNQNITSELDSFAPSVPRPRSAVLTISSKSPSLKKVDLAITYNHKGSPKTVNFTTYLGELGVGQY